MIFDLQRFVDEMYLATANNETVTVYSSSAVRRNASATSDTALKPQTKNAHYVGANAGAGNDYVIVDAGADGLSIKGGKGNDTIKIEGNSRTYGNTYLYEYGEGYDTIIGWNVGKDKLSIDGSFGNNGYQTLMSQDGNDFIVKYEATGQVTFRWLEQGDRVMIKGSSGEMHFAKVQKIMQGNAQNNTLSNTEESLGAGKGHTGTSTDFWTIDGGEGNDTITNEFDYVSIKGGDGKDKIYINASNSNANTVTSGVTINGGTGDDLIDVRGDTVTGADFKAGTGVGSHVYQFGSNDGYDSIYGFSSNDTINFTGVNADQIKAEIKYGGNFVITAGNTYITIVKPTDAELGGTTLNLQINGTNLNDEQFSTIVDESASAITKNSTSGNHEIAKYILLSNSSENKEYDSSYNHYTIDAAGGADTLTISGSNMSINGGDNLDRILILSSNNTIVGGYTKDYIANFGNNQVYEFGNNDGSSDYILNFTDNSTIKAIYDNSTINSQEITSYGIKLRFSSTYVIIKGALIEDNLPAQPATPLNTEDENSVAEWDTYNSAYNEYIFSPYNYRVIPDNSTIFIETSNGTTTFTTPQLFYVSGTFDNTVDNCLIECSTFDNNTITNYGNNVTINANLNTTIEDFGSDTTISRVNLYRGTNGNDTINNSTSRVSIIAGYGDDSITNSGDYVSIQAGEGNNSITNSGERVSILAGDGNDYITNTGERVSIFAGDGNDYITNTGDYVNIYAGYGDDSITNSGDYVNIYAGEGNDTIINTGKTIYFYGAYDVGDKFISNTAVGNTTTSVIKLSSGNDTVYNSSDYVSIQAGAGEDRKSVV